jgi:NAD(P)-dependent dehydrogenase (short-subunit alcohol dehydrogenase family)
LDLTPTVGDPNGIAFRTVRADERFRRVDMTVAGDGLSGQVSTFVRSPTIEAPSFAQLGGHVTLGEFAGAKALVVGGSRGVGALTAKLLAAGGAQVVVTYARGRSDAESLCSEINAAYGTGVCSALALDAMQSVAPQLAGVKATHLYYCATPQIFVQKSAVFVPALYAEFSRVYVEAFYETCMAVMDGVLSALYPSSIAVTARPEGMTEYSMAKAAGEMLCADMQQAVPNLRIVINRLPRILTDQTATVATAESADPIGVMLPLVRDVQNGEEKSSTS